MDLRTAGVAAGCAAPELPVVPEEANACGSSPPIFIEHFLRNLLRPRASYKQQTPAADPQRGPLLETPTHTEPALERAMDIFFFLLPLTLVAGEYFLTRSRKRADDAKPCNGCI